MNTLGNSNKHTHLATLALALALIIMGGVAQAKPAANIAPSLGSAAHFAVLSAAPKPFGAVTLTGSTVNGDVGSSGPMVSVVQTGSIITGAVIAPVSTNVVTDFNKAYDALAAVPCGVVLTGTLDAVILPPGVYCFDAAATLTGVLTLEGPTNGIWIFKIGTTYPATDPVTGFPTVTGALTGTNFSVVMAGGGQACNVYWLVAQAATMTDSVFVGTILAGADITITRGTFTGNALATAGVTMTDTALVGCKATATGGGKGGKGK